MSMFFCEGCQELRDADYTGCNEHPESLPMGPMELCDECLMELEEANDKPWSQTVKGATLKRSPPSEDR
jgi:hypothetical protein